MLHLTNLLFEGLVISTGLGMDLCDAMRLPGKPEEMTPVLSLTLTPGGGLFSLSEAPRRSGLAQAPSPKLKNS